ncbi:MAG: helix-turn-helix domain-containing protein [Planctomycetales bacterium]|nr:helix-turn-helix domain-containing protein [Planctomycetales bacterium]
MSTETEARPGKPVGPILPRRGRGALAVRLIGARVARGLSQAAAAEEIGCSREFLARVETGEEPRLPLFREVLVAWIAGRWPVEGR